MGSGYDTEYDLVSTPLEDRISSTKAVLFYEVPILMMITYFLSLLFHFKFSFWAWFVVAFCTLQLIYDWFKYFKNDVFVKAGANVYENN